MTARRYVYLIGATFTLRGAHGTVLRTQNGTTAVPEPITSLEDVRRAGAQFADHLASENPAWDRADPCWRDTFTVVGCSLLAVEVDRDGEWVLDEQQPWGLASVGRVDV